MKYKIYNKKINDLFKNRTFYFSLISFYILFFIFSLLSVQADHFDEYLTEMESFSNIRIPTIQRDKLKAFYNKPGNIKELSTQELNKKHEQCTVFMKEYIKNNWERKTQSEWPKYKKTDCPVIPFPKGKEPIGNSPYRTHFIIPQAYNGPHKWWNLFPVLPHIHSRIHSSPLISKCSFIFRKSQGSRDKFLKRKMNPNKSWFIPVLTKRG